MSRARDTADQINRVNSSAADATAITVDSSERVLIGKASAGYNVDGFEAHPNGETYVSRSGTPMAINRNSSDGTLLNFYKDGAGVGSIDTSNGDLIISGRTSSAKSGIRFDNNTITPALNGADVDASVNLGYSARRFNDLYLSGGVYLGGAVAANKLSDYEEGTHSATFAMNGSGSISMLRQNIGYVKVGRLVTITGEVTVSSVSSPVGSMTMTLPFIISSNVTGRDTFFGAKPVAYSVPHVQDNTPVIVGNTVNAQVTFLYEQDNAPFAAYTPAANATFNMSFSYLTTA